MVKANFAVAIALAVVLSTEAGSLLGGQTQAQRIALGARLAHDVGKGNCLACHAMPSDASAETSANIGPPLIGMQQRFPDRDKLRRQIWDAGQANPDTIMPPFGRHQILTTEEIDLIVDYLYSL